MARWNEGWCKFTSYDMLKGVSKPELDDVGMRDYYDWSGLVWLVGVRIPKAF